MRSWVTSNQSVTAISRPTKSSRESRFSITRGGMSPLRGRFGPAGVQQHVGHQSCAQLAPLGIGEINPADAKSRTDAKQASPGEDVSFGDWKKIVDLHFNRGHRALAAKMPIERHPHGHIGN